MAFLRTCCQLMLVHLLQVCMLPCASAQAPRDERQGSEKTIEPYAKMDNIGLGFVCVSWSADSSRLIVVPSGFPASSRALRPVSIWDMKTGELKVRITTPKKQNAKALSHGVLSRDGSIAAWGDANGVIAIANVDEAKIIDVRQSSDRRGTKLAFSPVDDVLVANDVAWYIGSDKARSKSKNAAVLLERPQRLPPGRALASVAAAFVDDGKTYWATTGDGSATFWDGHSFKLRRTVGNPTFAFGGTWAISADGKLIASTSSTSREMHEIAVWQASDGKILSKIRGKLDGMLTISFHRSGKILATDGVKGAKIWDVKTGRHLATAVATQPSEIPELKMLGLTDCQQKPFFSPDGTKLAVVGMTVELWNTQDLVGDAVQLE